MNNETGIFLNKFNYRFDLGDTLRRFLNDLNKSFGFNIDENTTDSTNIEGFSKWEDIREIGVPFMSKNISTLWLFYFTEAYNTVVKHKEELAAEGLSYSDIIAMLEN